MHNESNYTLYRVRFEVFEKRWPVNVKLIAYLENPLQVTYKRTIHFLNIPLNYQKFNEIGH